MEKKPTKKEQLTLVNNVLKLSTKLLKVSRALWHFHYQLNQAFALLLGEDPGNRPVPAEETQMPTR